MLNFLPAQAQKLRTKSQRAIEYYKQADTEIYDQRFASAENLLLKCIDIDSKFIDAYLLLAEVYRQQDKFTEAENLYLKVLKSSGEKAPEVNFYIADLYISAGYYEKALVYFEKILTISDLFIDKKKINRQIENCKFGIAQTKNPKPLDFINLGSSINSEFHEYRPILTANEQQLIFTVTVPLKVPDIRLPDGQEDFFIAMKEDGKWLKRKPLGVPLNTFDNEGAHTVSLTGKYLYYTACNRPNSYGRCDIYAAKIDENGYSAPYNIGIPVNTEHWESQPSISPDGNTLYFVSNRPGGLGGKDIWKSTKNATGKWQEPVNLGASVNTSADEINPFIHYNGSSLYFSTNGRVGMGEYDLYVAEITEMGINEPVNLGFPINTHKSETDIFITPNGNSAFVSANKPGGFGKIDIWFFEMPELIKPKPVRLVFVSVFDQLTKQNITGKTNLGIETSTKEKITAEKTTTSACFTTQANTTFEFSFTAPGYFSLKENWTLKDSLNLLKTELRYELKPIKEGDELLLKNVYFETDLHVLKPESTAELMNLVLFLKENSSVTVEISGHTDNSGTEKHNLELSKNRAKSVVDFLVANGIKAGQLKFAGYGSSKPAASNETADGKALNRRTIMTILSK